MRHIDNRNWRNALGKLKLFVSNFLVYGMGGIIAKVVPLIMLPIITRLMPNTEYFGVSDMSAVVVSFCSALAIMGMYDAMYRMFFDRNEDDLAYKKEICSTAFVFTLCTSLIVFIVLLLLKDFIAEAFLGNKEYTYVVYITAIATLIGATNTIVSAPTRMQNKRGVFLITNFLSPILSYSVSIPLLLNGYYVLALPVAGVVSALILEVSFILLNRKWFSFRKFNFKYLKQMLLIAVPLLPNFIIYWVFDSSDRLMLTNILGIGVTGIYSVSAKLGHVSQLIYTAFAGGWQFFAFSIMKEKDQVKTNSKIFEYLGIISFVCSAFVFALAEPMFKLLFEGEYVVGYIAAPYLFFAPLLLMLFQVACNQFLVIKKTWPNMIILSLGAIVNVVFNFVFIPIIGMEGAAIATLCGYTVSVIVCVLVLIKMKQMTISFKFVLSSLFMVAFVLIWRLVVKDVIWISTLCAIALSVILILFYLKDVKLLFSSIKNGIKKKKTEESTDAEGTENNL